MRNEQSQIQKVGLEDTKVGCDLITLLELKD